MKTFSLYLLMVFFPVSLLHGQKIVPPSIKSTTSFAIVTDTKSMHEASKEINAYKRAIEQDGLGTYIISHVWENPDQIRNILIKLYNQREAPLEGVVFVGDIPIPMLRDAQHLTSAFKMNQARNWQQSSIPSDRYYDDFGLKFDYLKQDSIKPLYFYYSLRADSQQELNSNIYSARIKPLTKGKKDKYTQLREYLNKVVLIKTQEKKNIIDRLTMARGHGYNSESRVAWAGEQLALKEQFPQVFKARNMVKYMDFDLSWPMKPHWLNEVQSPDLDIMLFHHHGSNDHQFVNGYKSGNDISTSIENIKIYLRSKISSAINKGKDKEKTISYYMESLDVPRSWCEEALDPKLLAKDSIMNISLDITVKDILKLTPNARFVVFDACYNGSFYEDENIAGAYLFNQGKTIVAQGNTVNTIQDKWPDEYLGLLNCGLRVGQWGKHVQYLETHILGDPTFRFANNVDSNFDINNALTVKRNDIAFWEKALTHPNVDIQAIALRVLFDHRVKGISQLLKRTYFKSPNMIVRLEALKLLAKLNNDDFIKVLKYAASDSYELTRRFALDYMTKNGSDQLIPAIAKAILTDNTSKRVRFKISHGLRMIDLDKLEIELKKQAEPLALYDRSIIDSALTEIQTARKSLKESLMVLNDSAKNNKEMALQVSRYRNQPITAHIDTLLRIVSDDLYDLDIRVAVAEALGWFNYSYKREYLINQLKNIKPKIDNPKLSNELTKTINRLTVK